jgi:hypothetical protein
MANVTLRPSEDWAFIIPKGTELPLPSKVEWPTSITNIQGMKLERGRTYQLVNGDYFITATNKNKRANWNYVYSLYAIHPVEDKLVRVPYGALHKTIIKHAEGTKDIMPGSGPLAAIVREIHAIRRDILKLGFEPRPMYPTRYQRPWVI